MWNHKWIYKTYATYSMICDTLAIFLKTRECHFTDLDERCIVDLARGLGRNVISRGSHYYHDLRYGMIDGGMGY